MMGIARLGGERRRKTMSNNGNYCEVCAQGGAILVGNQDASQYLCRECANEAHNEAEQSASDFRDADAYGEADIDNSMGIGEWD
jgi:hypothetical protein